MYNINNVKLWICNHKRDAKLSNYVSNPNYEVYNVYDEHEGKNIDNYNPFLSEYVLQYYVSANNIKSELVGFCHYSKIIDIANIKNYSNNPEHFLYYDIIKLRTNGFFAINCKQYSFVRRQINEYGGPNTFYFDVCEYLNKQKIVDTAFIQQYTEIYEVPFIACELYVIDWDGFIKLTKFINGYLDFIYKKYNIDSFESFRDHIDKYAITYYRKYTSLYKGDYCKSCYQYYDKFKTIFDEDGGLGKNNCWRQYAYIIEILVSIFLAVYLKQDCKNLELY